jgi:hypothetical protein
MNKKTLQKFVLDPEWGQMQEYIVAHFERSSSIEDIDVTNDSSVVHAEVIARQQIKDSLDKLKASFDSVKPDENTKKVSFK